MPQENTIKSKERVRKYGEVFTPEWLVSDMVDLVEPDISKPETTVLEPACGTGNFLVEILRRKLANCGDDKERIKALRSLYGVELLPDNVCECHSRLIALMPESTRKRAAKVVARNIVQGNFLNGRHKIWFLKDSEYGLGV